MNKKKTNCIVLIFICLVVVGCQYTDNNQVSISASYVSENTTNIIVEQTLEKNKLPWGFDEKSYSLLKNGALDEFVKNIDDVDQCISSDLDMDGTDDLILSIIIPESIDNNMYSFELNTLILKGYDNDIYKLVSENRYVNDSSNYGIPGRIKAGNGWFKFIMASGKVGGTEQVKLFKFNKNLNDWFLAEYYSNEYGNIDCGESSLETPLNFGVISFKEYEDIFTETYYNDLSVDTPTFKVDVRPCYVTLQDKEKESRVNKLIEEDLIFIINNLKNLNSNVDVSLHGATTFVTPEIISIEYGFHEKCFTTIIDINQEKRVDLSDIIDVKKLIEIINKTGFSDDVVFDNNTQTKEAYFKTSETKLIELLESSDDLETIVSTENSSIFCSIYEKSLCIYFQPNFLKLDSDGSKLYISTENLLPFLKTNYWKPVSEAAEHIVWKG